MTNKALTEKSIDHSSMDSFAFSFCCDRCGKAWRSETIPFTVEDVPKNDNDEVRKLLWMQDHGAAFDRANLEAQFHFNLCPACGRQVCDDCFRPLVNDRYDLCCDCVVKPIILCSACGFDNLPGAKICVACGHKLE